MGARIRRAAAVAAYVFFFFISCFTIIAPRHILERLYVHVWSWVLLLPVVWWLYGFIRSLYRGGE